MKLVKGAHRGKKITFKDLSYIKGNFVRENGESFNVKVEFSLISKE